MHHSIQIVAHNVLPKANPNVLAEQEAYNQLKFIEQFCVASIQDEVICGTITAQYLPITVFLQAILETVVDVSGGQFKDPTHVLEYLRQSDVRLQTQSVFTTRLMEIYNGLISNEGATLYADVTNSELGGEEYTQSEMQVTATINNIYEAAHRIGTGQLATNSLVYFVLQQLWLQGIFGYCANLLVNSNPSSTELLFDEALWGEFSEIAEPHDLLTTTLTLTWTTPFN